MEKQLAKRVQMSKGTSDTQFFTHTFVEDEIYSEVSEDLTYDIEADYIHKLKTQRQRMEKLEKCYNEKEHLLSKQVSRTNQLLQEIEKITIYIPFKEKYQNLKKEHNDLIAGYNGQQQELKDVRQELSHVVNENSITISHLKAELKNIKSSSHLNAKEFQDIINEKDQQLRSFKKDWKMREEQFEQQMKKVKDANSHLKQSISEYQITFEKGKDHLKSDLKNRELKIFDLERNLENFHKTNLELKNDLMRLNEQLSHREQQFTRNYNKIKNQLAQSKNKLSDKDSKIEDQTNQLKKAFKQIDQLNSVIQKLKMDYEKTCQLYENGNKRIKYENKSEVQRLESFVEELKNSIEELMDVKNHLLTENRKLMSILRKKESAERHRKELLKTQFKQINRIQKVIDRLE